MNDPQPAALSWWIAPVHITAFLSITLVSYALLSVGVVIALIVGGHLDVTTNPEALIEVLGAGGNGALAIALHATIGLASLVLGFTLPLGKAGVVHIPTNLGEIKHKLVQTFALGPGRLAYLVPAALGALTVGLAAGWFSQRVDEFLPGDSVSLALIGKLLTEGTGVGWGIMVFAVVISAPVLEELAFRGYIFSLVERASHPSLAWVLSSLLFMLYHQDPVHILGLAPTAFFLGWLRMVSGSVWPSMLAHLVNNGLAVAMTVFLSDVDTEATWPVAAAALGFTVLVSAATWTVLRIRQPEGSDTAGTAPET